MKKRLTMVLILCLLLLTVGGCDTNEPSSSAAPESASKSASTDTTTTTTEKAISTQEDAAQTTALHCRPSNTTTRRGPLTSRITTTTTTWGKTNADCTYPTAPFTVGEAVREWDEVFTEDFSGQVITSKAQLDALALSQEYGTERYTEQYFEDKALVVLEFRLTSGSFQLRIDTVGVNGNTMTVFYTTVCPNPSSNDMAYHRILLEISQKAADGIEHIVRERVLIQLPSGSPPDPTAL